MHFQRGRSIIHLLYCFFAEAAPNIEKGVLITTGSFSKAAIDEASAPEKQQIDLMDGEGFLDQLAEFGLNVQKVKDYEIGADFLYQLYGAL